MKRLFWLSFIANILLIVVLSTVLVKSGLLTNYFSNGSIMVNPKYEQRISLFEKIEKDGQIVFLGDSITERGLWSEFFPESSIANRGIESDTTEGVLKRIDDISKSKPEKLFIMIGVNDLIFDVPLEETIDNYSDIIESIKSQSPETEIFTQSVLPVEEGSYGINNDAIDILNEEILILSNSNEVEYIDLNSIFKNNSNHLKDEYSEDGLHLNGNAYEVWISKIEKLVK